ncbi:MAG: c-type cytochrome [Thioalkalivibrio sp.]|jgi:cytochrome c553|nr:c-type cytochrome [Thioalkalivibrio sp.]
MKNKILLLATITGAAVMLSATAQAGDVQAGQAKYQSVCLSCHGAEGQGQAIFPALVGQDAEYVADKLKRYRAGEEVGEHTALMRPHAQALSDDDIANLAAYIESEFN